MTVTDKGQINRPQKMAANETLSEQTIPHRPKGEFAPNRSDPSAWWQDAVLCVGEIDRRTETADSGKVKKG